MPPSLIKVVIAQLTRRRDRAESQALPPLGPRSFPYPISSIFDQPRLKLHHHLFACVRACVCSPEPLRKTCYQWTRTPSKMSSSLFDTSFPPLGLPIKATLICSYQLQPLPSATRSYRSILNPRSSESSPSLLLSMQVLGAVVSRGQRAKYAHSSIRP